MHSNETNLPTIDLSTEQLSVVISKARAAELSRRENQVMEYVVMGMTNKSIARKLYLTERTIKFHCSNIYRKLQIKNRASLVSLMTDNLYQEVAEHLA